VVYIAPLPFKEPVKPSLVLQWFSGVVNMLYGTSYGSTYIAPVVPPSQ